MTIGSLADRSLKRTQSLDYYTSYKKDLAFVKSHWDGFVRKKRLEENLLMICLQERTRDFIYDYAPSPASMANLNRNLSALLKDKLESNVSLY